MKIIFRIIAFPALLVLSALVLIGKLLTNLASLPIGLFYILLALCGIYCLFQQKWLDIAILAGIALASYLAIFVLVAAVCKIEMWNDSLKSYIFS